MPNWLADKLRQYTSLDAPQDQGIGDMIAEGVAGFVPGVGQAMAVRDIERGRRSGSAADIALGAVGLMPWGKAASGIKKVIAGRAAKHAPHEALNAGEDAMRAGAHPDAVWAAHGVEQGLENHRPMQWEINDQPAKLTAKALRGDLTGKLPDLLDHPELYKNYPHLNNVNVEGGFGDSWNHGGSYMHQEPGAKYNGMPLSPTIEASARDQDTVKNVLLHEIQHAVQRTEGFDAGANPDFIKAAILKNLRGMPAGGQVSDSAVKKMADDKYLKNLGEQQARATGDWMNKGAVERSWKRPSQRHDFPGHEIMQEKLPGYK